MLESPSPQGQRCLLIAMPQLQDPFFHRSTTLISEFNKDGAMGVILNRPLTLNLNGLMGKQLKLENVPPLPVFWGGPVQNDRGLIIHEDPSLAADSVELEPGLFMSGSSETLTKLIDAAQKPAPPRFRFFLGYAGWGAGQLEQEMSASSWVTAPLNRTFVFDENIDTLWQRSLSSIGVDLTSLAATLERKVH